GSYREAALAGLGVLPAIAARYPRAAGAGGAPAPAAGGRPPERPPPGSSQDERTGELQRTALHAAPPGAVTAYGNGTDAQLALLEGRGPVDGAPAAYVCREFACQAPVTTPEQLRDALAATAPA